MLKFYVKVFMTSLFLNSVLCLFHVWHSDRCWSKILCSTIPNPIHVFKVKVTDLEILIDVLCFYNICFREASDGLIHVWHGDRNWSKMSYGTIPNPVHDLQVKVTDLEFYIKVFVIIVLQFQFFL